MKEGANILLATMKLDIGGAETHIVELAKELKARGYNPIVASNGGVYTAELERFGIKHYKVPLHNKQPQNLITSAKRLSKIIREEKIDVVHSHARIPAFLLKYLHRRMDFPFVTTAHWVFNTGYGLRYVTDWGEKVIAVSDDIKDYLMENYYVPESDITVTVNGIDTNKFSPDTDGGDIKKELGITDERVIVCVSRLDSSRSEAAKKLVSIAPRLAAAMGERKLRIIVVGDGDDFDRIKSMKNDANSLAGYECVTLTGARTDIEKFVAVSDLFVGVSRAALEAMAASKPVILAGNEGYIGLFGRESLEIGIDTNFCCRGCGDITEDKLFSDIEGFFALPDLQKDELGALGRDVVISHYSIARMADDTVSAYEKAMRRREIIVSGYFGFRNSGDDALLSCLINDLRSHIDSPSITVLSASPKQTTKEYGVRSLGRLRYGKINRAMRHGGMLISGGGTLIQDVTSSRSLYYYLCVIKAAKKHGLPVMMYANGIGPIRHKYNVPQVKKTIDKVDLITLRDPDSRKTLESLGITSPYVKVTSDPVIGMQVGEGSRGEEILSSVGVPRGARVLGGSLRKTRDRDPNFEDKIASVCDKIHEEFGLYTVFIPMQTKRDVKITESVCRKMKSPAAVVPDNLGFDDVLSVVSRCTMCIGMRLHLLIYSILCCVPAVGLSYDPKIDSFMSYMGFGRALPVSELDTNALLSASREILSDIEYARFCAERCRRHMKKLTDENGRLAAELYARYDNEKTT
ncbi:MAG: polysaccharide pyruvyl transferase CsaB [Firmicutes bacterium]|nr:polysaccharide pyruvyl transferase CsaB [Bacillota bacterium]